MSHFLRTFDKKPASRQGRHLTFDRLKKLVTCHLSLVTCRKGYTLVEFLVVIGLLLTAVGVALVFLTSILKGSNQANITAEVKQNGQIVLDALERQIRNADSATVGAGIAGKHIKLTLPKPSGPSNALHIKCFNDSTAVGKSSNGWIGIVASDLEDPGETLYASLTNLDAVSGVDVTKCNFNVIAEIGQAPPIVNLNFTVNQGVDAPSRQDFVANVFFATTISLRHN